MSSEMSLEEANAEAVRRIRAAKACGQWWLDLGDLPITRVPDEIVELKDTLRVLGLGKERLGAVGDTTGWVWDASRPASLTDLLPWLPSTGPTAREWEPSRPGSLTDLTPVARLSALQELSIIGTAVTDLAPLAGLSALTTLEASVTGVTDLAPLAGLPALASLNLSGCRMTDLGPLAGLHALTSLDVSATEVTDLGPLAGLTALATLNLRFTQMTDLGPLSGLSALTKLSLWETRVADLGPLAGLPALASLDVSATRVTDLGPLSGLTALTKLSVCDTRVTDLGPLAGLPALFDLHLSRCPWIKELRPLLGELPSLRKLRVYGCRFHDLHPSLYGQWDADDVFDAVRAYDAALGPDAKPDAEIKVFVLGNGRCGKSYLIQRLMGKTWEQIEAERITTTHGIQLGRFQVPDDWGFPHPVTLCFWDFGGQDIYHGTHALFLKEPAIYLLLYSDATENDDRLAEGGFEMQNRRLSYWFDYLRQEAGGRGVVSSPVLFVKSRCDEPRPAVPTATPDPRAFPHITPAIPASAKDPRGLKHLLPHLEEAVGHLLAEHPQPPLPASWARVRDHIRELQKAKLPRTMTLGQLGAVCAECGCNPGDEVFLRDALALMGVVYYRKGVFADRIIIDQAWALDAIYTVFKRDHPKFQRKIDDLRGRLTREDLELYFWADHPIEDQRTFLSFMEQCGICFRASDRHDQEYEGNYILPDKLDHWGVDHGRQFRRQLADASGSQLTAAFTLLHDGIARHLLSRIGSVAGDRATYWRYGCHFYDAVTDCEVLIRTDGNTVRLFAWGDKTAGVLGTLAQVLEQVPCGQPPDVAWGEDGAAPIRIGRDDPDEKPEERLKPSKYGPKSVFFSYRHPHPDHPGSDRGRLLLRQLRDLLTTQGWTVLLDEQRLQDGDSISDFITDVRECGFLVPVFCGRYLDSRYTLSELFTFREKFAHDEPAFADRTAPVTYPESGVQNDLRQAEYVLKCRTMFDEHFRMAGQRALAPRVYEAVFHLNSWGGRLSEVLAALSDRLSSRTAEAVAERLNRQYERLHPSRTRRSG